MQKARKPQKGDPAIGRRAHEECLRLFPGMKETTQALGCNKDVIRGWRQGRGPSAKYMARLYELGADVIWILTGKREKEDG